ncbi:hypothetical protein EOPP23_01705 [Endozoicomonas sp. OPT23]|nr:hypothetical protein [Endozoicomonas sp. OPT23]
MRALSVVQSSRTALQHTLTDGRRVIFISENFLRQFSTVSYRTAIRLIADELGLWKSGHSHTVNSSEELLRDVVEVSEYD